jgi:DNA-directed RNA polymerase sigma subunit (sigma70/sigma32)
VDVNPRTGSVKMNFPDKELWELSETCALDVADRAGITLEEVGVIMNLTRERVRQLEMRGLSKLRVIADDEAPAAASDPDDD